MSSSSRKAIIGSRKNFWLHSTKTGFDLTHPSTPESPQIIPRIPFDTTTARVTVDPAKSALVIVDMQNFFLSPALGRPHDGKGLAAVNVLLKHAIPAARKADVRIIWLNWGLTNEDIEDMPPATLRAFGFESVPEKDHLTTVDSREAAGDDHGINTNMTRVANIKPPFGKDPRIYKGLGSEVGQVELDNGKVVDGGRLLMRDQWNAELFPTMETARQEGAAGKVKREDVWIHKNRMSGLWGAKSDCTDFLEKAGIKSLFFAGVNTDQCVGGSLQDAFTKGYDCFLLSDGSATTSPNHAQQCVEYNTAKTWGFVLSCEDFAKGVDNIQTS